MNVDPSFGRGRIRPAALLAAMSLFAFGGSGMLLGKIDTAPSATPTPIEGSRPLSAPAEPQRRAAGGSLADTVRGTQSRGRKKKQSLGAITNESLRKGEHGSGKGNLILAPRSSAPAPANVPALSEIRDATGRTESDWRQAAAAARKRAVFSEAEAKRLEDETKRLENEFYAWSDGNYRDRVLKPAWDQAKDELKKARIEVDQSQLALTDLEEEARKAGAAPGWLRETK